MNFSSLRRLFSTGWFLFSLGITGGITTGVLSCATLREKKPVLTERQPASLTQDKTPDWVLIHANDLYEMTPSSSGKGGIDRLAGFVKATKAAHPQTFFVLSGDFLSPSVTSSSRRLIGSTLEEEAGRHMIELLNAAQLDYVTFGNHEFDVSLTQLHQRMQASQFQWISTNLKAQWPHPVPSSIILTTQKPDGSAWKLGLIGLTLNKGLPASVTFHDFLEATRREVQTLENQEVSAIVALTHLTIEQDRALAEQVPGLTLILGGHEHQHHYEVVSGVPIAKADQNAETVYVHKLFIDSQGNVLATSKLKTIDHTTPSVPEVKYLIDQWSRSDETYYASRGFQLNRVLGTLTEALDGREDSLAKGPTLLSQLVAATLFHKVEGAHFAFFNSSLIRLEGLLEPGPLRERDFVRTMPRENSRMLAVEMTGAHLKELWNQQRLEPKTIPSGQELHFYPLPSWKEGIWKLGEEIIQDDQTYRGACTEFLYSQSLSLGKMKKLPGRIKPDPGIHTASSAMHLEDSYDIRKAVIERLLDPKVSLPYFLRDSSQGS